MIFLHQDGLDRTETAVTSEEIEVEEYGWRELQWMMDILVLMNQIQLVIEKKMTERTYRACVPT